MMLGSVGIYRICAHDLTSKLDRIRAIRMKASIHYKVDPSPAVTFVTNVMTALADTVSAIGLSADRAYHIQGIV